MKSGALLKYAINQLHNVATIKPTALPSPPKPPTATKSNTATGTDNAHLATPELSQGSSNIAQTPVPQEAAPMGTGQQTYFNGKTGQTAGFTSDWQQLQQSTFPAPKMSKINSLHKFASKWLKGLAGVAGVGSLGYGAYDVGNHYAGAEDRGKHQVLTQIPKALLIAAMTGSASYAANSKLKSYNTRGKRARSDLQSMQDQFRGRTNSMRLRKSSALPYKWLAAGLGTAAAVPVFSSFAKGVIDDKTKKEVNKYTKYLVPGAAALGLSGGYVGKDIYDAYQSRKAIGARDSYINNLNAMRGQR